MHIQPKLPFCFQPRPHPVPLKASGSTGNRFAQRKPYTLDYGSPAASEACIVIYGPDEISPP